MRHLCVPFCDIFCTTNTNFFFYFGLSEKFRAHFTQRMPTQLILKFAAAFYSSPISNCMKREWKECAKNQIIQALNDLLGGFICRFLLRSFRKFPFEMHLKVSHSRIAHISSVSTSSIEMALDIT